MADQNGSVCFQMDYLPYGQENTPAGVTNTCSTSYEFTGYERDAETGLDYAFARYYNAREARFMSADPLGGNITDPQTLNKYTYVRNNPANLTDPWGQFLCGDCEDPLEPYQPEQVTTIIYLPNCPSVVSALIGGGSGCASQVVVAVPTASQLKPAPNRTPQSPGSTKTCSGSARVLQGNAATIGKPGGFSGKTAGPILVTANGAAVIPSQFGGKGALRPYLNQISGVFPNVNASFQGVVDVIGSRTVPNVQAFLMSKNPGDLILELPGASKDNGVTAATLTVPAGFPCPSGTTQVP